MSATNYLEDALLNATLAATTYTSPANVYVALYSTAPTESTSGTELSGNGYARQEATFSVTSGVASSTADVTFTATGGNWSTAVAWGIVNASSAGNILYYNTLVPSQTVLDGDDLIISSGNITITMN